MIFKRWLSAGVVAALLLGGCTNNHRPIPPLPTTKVTPNKPMPGTRNSQVAEPWKLGDPQYGIDVYLNETNDSDRGYKAKVDRICDYIVELGANSVAFSFPIFVQGGLNGNTVAPGKKTPSPDRIKLTVQTAQAHKLRVKLRPALDQANLKAGAGGWRGTVQPGNRAQWFTSYANTLQPYLAVAQSVRLTTFAIGVELNSLEGDPHWAAVVNMARQLYGGEISYSVEWEGFTQPPPVYPVPQIGIDAYPPFDLKDYALPAQLLAAWNGWLDKSAQGRDLTKITLDEVGIPSARGAFRHPYRWDDPSMVYAPQVGGNWYAAACRAAVAHRMAGVYIWKVNFDQDPLSADPETDPPTSIMGRPAEGAIRACFTA